MSKNITVRVVVEGQTEQIFIKDILAPYMAVNGIFMVASRAFKPGQKGGDIKFQRVKRDIGNFLAQRNVDVVSTFVDFYGIKEWPGKDKIVPNFEPEQIAATLNSAAEFEICQEYERLNPMQRFIPFIAVHEFETLLFSDTKVLADGLEIDQKIIDETVNEFHSLEHINNSRETAPSKRLEKWYPQFGKTTTGIAIAKKIPVDMMRAKCPLFNQWLLAIEAVAEV